MNKKILILGSSGLLGSSLRNYFKNNNIQVLCHSRKSDSKFSADLTIAKDTLEMLSEAKPDIIINLAGMTDVNLCEKNPNLAYVSNVKIIENIKLYLMLKSSTCHLIHISTDHIYDSSNNSPENEVAIKNYYAFSKYAGELAAMSIPMNVSVIRTNFFGLSLCEGRKSFTDWLYESGRNKTKINVFDDVKFSPLSMKSLSKYISLIIEHGPIGIMNLGSRDGMSKADFSYLFIEKLGLDCSFMTRLNSTDLDQYTKISRPFDMRMDSTNFEKTFNLKLPTLLREIESVKEDYYEKNK